MTDEQLTEKVSRIVRDVYVTGLIHGAYAGAVVGALLVGVFTAVFSK